MTFKVILQLSLLELSPGLVSCVRGGYERQFAALLALAVNSECRFLVDSSTQNSNLLRFLS